MSTLSKFRAFNLSALSAVLIASSISLPAAAASPELLMKIQSEMTAIEIATAKSKVLRDRKTLSGIGWTSLDDMVLGGATIGASAAMLGAMAVIPRLPQKIQIPTAITAFSRPTIMMMAGIGALYLAQGVLVYFFVPKGELDASDAALESAKATVPTEVHLDSLNDEQARGLLEKLVILRAEIEQTTVAFEQRVAPKLESRLQFIASNILTGGVALTAIGGVIYVAGATAGRQIPVLSRFRQYQKLTAFLAEHEQFVRTIGQGLGGSLLVQGLHTVLTGGIVKMFVPAGTVAAPPVN